ncbi:prepilin peptidase [Sphingomonas lutea]|uniref:Prepilin peptidase n=1 Tax=Sphingomonas lutea TaxID=1045317 RepID=A0A7G9SES3_9SPHN|nr:prepilin peptidase [Sphingomonas lutea]QNN66348.1 prepilin peptidase [Sphingomonas lutea]
MINVAFTGILMGILALLLVIAAVVDIRTFTISNKLNLAVALLAPLYWYAAQFTFGQIVLMVAAAVVVFLLFAATFYAGLMGGGDVKLAAALALWFPPYATIKMLVLMSVAGGVLTLGIVAWHRFKNRPGKPEIPYGVAIASGGLVILAQRFLNQFA